MGRFCIRNHEKAAWVILEKYYTCLGNDFHRNKYVGKEITIISDKKLRDRRAGYIPHLMEQIWRGISIKLQEEERQKRRDNDVPEVSALDPEFTKVGPDTKETLRLWGFHRLSNLWVSQPTVGINFKTPRGAVWIFLQCCSIFS
ncbi:small ribosomal subunit protein eS17-like [Chlorocebus sabaeus]|uniref:small ribosomal subunit protein eS17-like n=1 Tax=Chlorocebus sabaeus TaxID=60711 RepID=UPI003BF99661